MTQPKYCPECGSLAVTSLPPQEGEFVALHIHSNVYECACIHCGSQCVILINDSVMHRDLEEAG